MNSETSYSILAYAYIYVHINNMLFSCMVEYYTDMKWSMYKYMWEKSVTLLQISQYERIHTFGSINIMYKNRQA